MYSDSLYIICESVRHIVENRKCYKGKSVITLSHNSLAYSFPVSFQCYLYFITHDWTHRQYRQKLIAFIVTTLDKKEKNEGTDKYQNSTTWN